MRALVHLVGILAGTLVPGGGILAQSSACLAQAESVRVYLSLIQAYYARTDSSATLAFGDPWASPSRITHVTK